MLSRYANRVTRTIAVLLTCLLLGVTMIAASQISEHSETVVGTAVDENWRGHYDLLVTAEGGLSEAAEETDGLIEQNFSTIRAGESISEDQLTAVAEMAEVEVSAPLAFVGQFANPSYSVPVGVSVDEDWSTSEFFSTPRAFEGTITTYYHDELGRHQLGQRPDGHFMITGIGDEEIVLQWWDDEQGTGISERHSRTAPGIQVIDVPESELCECLALVPVHSLTEDEGAQVGSLVNEGHTTTYLALEDPADLEQALAAVPGPATVYTTYEVVPELHSNMVAVDPVAERALLGQSGAFLDSLIEFEQLQETLGDGPCQGNPADERAPGECLADLVDPEQYEQIHTRVFHGNSAQEGTSLEYDDAGNAVGAPGGPIIPIIYSETEYPEMTAEASFPELAAFEGLSYEEATSFQFYQQVLQGERPPEPAVQEVNLTEELTPFVYEGFDITFGLGDWDAPEVSGSADSSAGTSTSLPGRADRSRPSPEQQAQAPDGVQTALVNEPQGRYFLDTAMTSSEQRYRPWSANYNMNPPSGALLAPVGSYTPGLEGASDEASYVPLGMYAEAEAEIAQPGDFQGMPLPPSFSGRGALLSSPGVITTMRGFEQYRGEVEADVLRVRVADVERYSAENLGYIKDVAEQIRELGLDVQVVAGSSLAPVAIYLPEFHEDSTDLGWTIEEWTSLGAAVQAEEAQMSASWLLLVVALAGVTVLACAVQLAGTRPRRREAAMLISLGWTRNRVRRWFLAEDLPAVLLVGAAAAAAVALSTSAAARLGGLAASAAFFVAVLAGVVAAASPASQHRRLSQGSAQPATKPAVIGRRLAWSSPGSVAMTALALLVLVTTAVTFVLVIVTARSQAGVTRIAGLVNAEVLLPQTVLAAGAVTAGVVMFVMAIRQTLRQARKQHRMLLTTGWPLACLASSIRAQLLTALAPGAVLAVLVSAAAIAALDHDAPALLAGVVLGVPAAAAVLALAWSHRYVSRQAG